MRKQFHFWPGEEDLDAWDVDRLIELSKDLPVEEVDLSKIWEVDTVYWFDGDGDSEQPTVRRVVDHVRWIEEVNLSYPIILGHDGRVMDGMDRVARALLEGRSTITARRFKGQLAPDYQNGRPDALPY